jgi:hypothetical protein
MVKPAGEAGLKYQDKRHDGQQPVKQPDRKQQPELAVEDPFRGGRRSFGSSWRRAH